MTETKWTAGPWLQQDTHRTANGLDQLIRSANNTHVGWAYRNEDADLMAAAPDLYEALEFAERRSRQPGEGHTAWFERLAAEFYDSHGIMAPGKDDPCPPVSYECRRDKWEAFLEEPAEARRNALKKARGES